MVMQQPANHHLAQLNIGHIAIFAAR